MRGITALRQHKIDETWKKRVREKYENLA